MIPRFVERLRLDELHNDSTTVSFFGADANAEREGTQRGRPTPAITWGHSKDHRPDLKQLLYTLTVTDDGGVLVYFTSASGNVVDDTTHRQTWDLLRQLVGRADFLYVADCKLASRENVHHLAVYYLVLLIQALLERQLRQALERSGHRALPLYPESRPCTRPTARRVFDIFETVQRHVVTLPDGREEYLVTELTPLQREILELLKMNPDTYGR